MLRRSSRAMATLLCGAAMAAAAALALLTLTGHRVAPVLSGSMEPVMPVGSAVVVEVVDASTVRVGDVITFDNPQRPGTRVTHRVISVREHHGERIFRTKGDANTIPDDWALRLPGQVGRKVAVLPHAGYVLSELGRPAVRGGLVAFVALLLLGWTLRAIWRPEPDRDAPAAAVPPAPAPAERRAAPTAYGTPW